MLSNLLRVCKMLSTAIQSFSHLAIDDNYIKSNIYALIDLIKILVVYGLILSRN